MILISCSSSLLIKLFTYSDFIKKKLVYCAFVRFYLCPTFFHTFFSLFDFQSIIDSASNWISPYYIYLTHWFHFISVGLFYLYLSLYKIIFQYYPFKQHFLKFLSFYFSLLKLSFTYYNLLLFFFLIYSIYS